MRNSGSPRSRRCWRRLAVVPLVSALFLTACAEGDVSVGGSDPTPTNRTLEQIDTATISLPAGLGDAGVLQPGWDLPPQELDGVFVGQSMGESGWLEFTAVDERGEILWLAERPPSCTGFALARTDDGRPLAILTNLVATPEAIATPTATAFDLRTGEEIWGPIEVTGPYKGPGLVFAAAPEGFMGDTGKKIALNPSTGDIIAAEDEHTTRRIVGEFQGALISVDADHLIAERPKDEGALETLRSQPLAEFGRDHAEISNQARRIDLGDQHIVIPSGDDSLAVLELEAGTVVVNHARDAAYDKQSDTLIILNDSEIVGFPANGEAWNLPVPGDARLQGLGGGIAYVHTYEANLAFNLTNGATLVPEFAGTRVRDTSLFLPVHTTEGGAAIIQNGGVQHFVPRR